MEALPLRAIHPGLKTNVFRAGSDRKLLKTKVIYGANASGKSNLLMAISFFNFAVTLSWNPESSILERAEPFATDPETREAPSFFEMRLLAEGVPYRYGFTVAPGGIVTGEWLFGTPGKKEVPFFTRSEDELNISATHLKSARKMVAAVEGEGWFVAPTSLLLSALGFYFKNDEVVPVYRTIANLSIINGALATEFDSKTVKRLADSTVQIKVRELLARADIELDELRVRNGSATGVGESADNMTLMGDVIREREWNLYVQPKNLSPRNRNGFRAETYLSKGTIKLLLLAEAIIRALDNGQCLVIDEFEARMHTQLSQAIIRMFNSEESNPKGAQLIVATHDTNLLSPLLLRRDQITFVDKDERGASSVYSLAQVKGVRDGSPYEKEYLSGRYGGVPVVNSL